MPWDESDKKRLAENMDDIVKAAGVYDKQLEAKLDNMFGRLDALEENIKIINERLSKS